jgi:hypothetical protein
MTSIRERRTAALLLPVLPPGCHERIADVHPWDTLYDKSSFHDLMKRDG